MASPNEKLMGRITNSTLDISISKLKPKVIDHVNEILPKLRNKQKEYGDRSNRKGKNLEEGDKVRLQVGN